MQDMVERCFICNIDRAAFDRNTETGFEHHIKQDHWLWAYMFMLAHLHFKPRTELTGVEQYLLSKALARDLTFFPLHRAMALDYGAADAANAARLGAGMGEGADWDASDAAAATAGVPGAGVGAAGARHGGGGVHPAGVGGAGAVGPLGMITSLRDEMAKLRGDIASQAAAMAAAEARDVSSGDEGEEGSDDDGDGGSSVGDGDDDDDGGGTDSTDDGGVSGRVGARAGAGGGSGAGGAAGDVATQSEVRALRKSLAAVDARVDRVHDDLSTKLDAITALLRAQPR